MFNLHHPFLASVLAVVALLGGNCAPAADSGNNLRWTVDLANRAVKIDGQSKLATAQFLGLDLHRVYTSSERDIGTLTVQPYLIRINNMPMHPPFFDGPDDWAVEYRILNFNYTALGNGLTNIRIGHFEIPFGIEQVVNTNGTLRDYMHGANIGLKADWGVTLNGENDKLEYELALSRGSGNNWQNRGSPHLVSGRVGTDRSRQWVAGLSLLTGRTSDNSQADFTSRRSRAAVDVRWFGPRINLMAEYSAGTVESQRVNASLLEIDAMSGLEAVTAYLQLRRFAATTNGVAQTVVNSNFSLGARVVPDNHWSFEAQLDGDLQRASRAPRSTNIAAQIRYRL